MTRGVTASDVWSASDHRDVEIRLVRVDAVPGKAREAFLATEYRCLNRDAARGTTRFFVGVGALTCAGCRRRARCDRGSLIKLGDVLVLTAGAPILAEVVDPIKRANAEESEEIHVQKRKKSKKRPSRTA